MSFVCDVVFGGDVFGCDVYVFGIKWIVECVEYYVGCIGVFYFLFLVNGWYDIGWVVYVFVVISKGKGCIICY